MTNEEKTLPRFKDELNDSESIRIEKSYLLVLSGSGAGNVFTLSGPEVILGRGVEAGITLDDTQCSREHVKIRRDADETVLEDLKSTNGTFVNGKKIKGQHRLAEGDEILLGQTLLRFSILNPIDGGRLGLLNHGYFELRLAEELDRAIRYKRSTSVMMLKMEVLPNAKIEQKEEFLRQNYAQVVNHTRKMIRTMDVLAHYGKFQLELLLPETGYEEAIRLAKRIVGNPSFNRGLHLSVGIASYPEDGSSKDVLLEKSRVALKAVDMESPERVGHIKDDVRRISMSSTEVIVKSEKMRAVVGMAERVAKSMITVLILGETGVGKEVVAEIIHNNSDRSQKPLVCINCAALTETLLESELFGHEKGSFTGAEQRKIGLFESASGGTIFLDEVGEMPQKTQAKLLRVLQSKKIMRVGSNQEISTDVRVVAATNRNLEEQVKKGVFREDLFYRLNAATILIPPLRERRDEVPYLVASFIEKFCQENGFLKKTVTPEAEEILTRYSWPGNIRELKNTVERAVIISDGNEIGTESLSNKMNLSSLSQAGAESKSQEPVAVGFEGGETQLGDMKEVVGNYEKQLIIKALNQCNWNQTKASELLNVPRRTLVSKIKKYKIKR